ncbi:hypothetical protein GQ43DRAFT_382776 [Delitschia confertaspora ATCC 74209]|uniref:Zn(2)-C6 fungal-type domain-containing protein n=1 Tax=Delitschia confertaspora ATCC 74209 TaxID=1513339 RepID=A0A9P4JBX0_9PLEO|nr:hypothetical protein GQ43DRAFT_382776 [Delitschia confertaspora ATCC 74209]
MTSRNSAEPSQDGNIRKRVGKACDRCRLKKSKCDGASPCSRCRTDNAICMFGERKKSQDKVYPKGYVEMLEQQQTQLIAATREMYRLLVNGQGWPGAPLPEAQGGHPLTHDILERLDLLQPTSEGGSAYEPFEEDYTRIQQRLLEKGATYTHRRGSTSSGSDHDHSHSCGSSSSGETPAIKSMKFTDPFARNNEPPTPPPMSTPFPQHSQITNIKTENSGLPVSPTFMNDNTLDPSPLNYGSWPEEPMTMDVSMDFRYIPPSEMFNNFGATTILDPGVLVVGSNMPTWYDPPDMDFNGL